MALVASGAQADPPAFPPSDYELRRAEALAREDAAAQLQAARRQARLDRRPGAGVVAEAATDAGVGAFLDPVRLVDLAILGVIGAAAISAIGSDASPVVRARAGSAAPPPTDSGPPASPPTVTATSTN